MKKFTTIMASFAFVFLMVFVTSCKNDAEEVTTVATYVSEKFTPATGDTTISCYYSAVFYSDGTFALKTVMGSTSLDSATGTYTGNPNEDGTITIKVLKTLSSSLTMQDVPAEYQDKYTFSVLVSDGKLTVPAGSIEEDSEVTFTRV